MGGWTIYCFVCGGTSHVQDLDRFCEGFADDDFLEHPRHEYNLPDEDAEHLGAVCIISDSGYVTPEGVCDWPSPFWFTIADTPENRAEYPFLNNMTADAGVFGRTYNVDPTSCRDQGYDGAKLHMLCAGILNREMQRMDVTWQQVYDWFEGSADDCNGLVSGIDYGYGRDDAQQQNFELYRDIVWTTRRPDRFPELQQRQTETKSKEALGSLGRLQQLPLEILCLVLERVPPSSLLALWNTSKSMRSLLDSPVCQQTWKHVCRDKGWISTSISADEPLDNADWRKYCLDCARSDNMRNRARIVRIARQIVEECVAASQ